jgi:stearoyl-CoA desaturase (delta-9 desaturase)
MSKAKQAKISLTQYAIPIFVTHLLALFAFIPSFITWYNAVIMLIGVLIFGQGINLGYHRLLTHRSLQVPKWLERFYVLLALCCMEETPGKWVSTHRKHHTDSDNPEDDPHSPTRSLFWSHMGWLVFRRGGKNSLNVDHRYAGDILDDRFYMFLEKKWWATFVIFGGQMLLYFLAGFGIFMAMGQGISTAAWSGLGVMMWGVMLRVVVVWHITWSVNSLSHVLGYQSYETGELSRNNWFVALIASGEGWHNNHHHDPASASVQHKWWEIDLTYYHILLLEKLGLAKSVVRPRHVRQKNRKKKKAASEADQATESIQAKFSGNPRDNDSKGISASIDVSEAIEVQQPASSK